MMVPFGGRNKMSKKSKISIKLDGNKISSGIFRRTVNSFFNLIDEVSNDVTKGEKYLEWYVTVEKGSTIISAEPIQTGGARGIDEEICRTVVSGVGEITNQQRRPDYFNDKALQSVQSLAKLITDKEKEMGVNHIEISSNGSKNEITHSAIANAKIMLKKSTYKSIGSIEGRLQVIKDRGGLKFKVYTDYYDKGVDCTFDESKLKKVVSAFQKRVSVYGEITSNKVGVPLNIKVEKIRVFKDNKNLPGFKDVLGLLEE